MRLLIFLCLLGGLTACGSSRSNSSLKTVDNGYTQMDARNQSGSIVAADNLDVTRTLDVHLSTLAGVNVTGNGANARVRIRGGINSFSGNTEPLFVLDGQAISGGFATVYGMVAVADIDQITVLKGSSATIYGTRGANGVIVIRTKRS